jgi:hypothetical protein
MNVNKKEVFYKFIFPDNDNIRRQEIKDLRDTDHADSPANWHVIAYDQLSAVNPTVLHYVNQYLNIPKYFNMRVYADDVNGTNISASQRQYCGVSLMVSDSPEVIDRSHCWTKFKSDYDNKIVYCSVIVSSGIDDVPLEDFYFNWNLPDEVLAKSGLRDSIVSSKFHNNWYFTQEDRIEYSGKGYGYIPVGREKRVFNKHYFKDDLTYSAQTNNAVDPPIKYSHLREDNKKGFVDLEVTRRILYGVQNSNSVSIPTVVSGTGFNTAISYYPPQEYITNPPMPIKRYDLLRAALCDVDPYGDCETVLIMWVANSDPSDISDGNVLALRNLQWRQYAIPISVRCCVKDDSGSFTYSNKRFMLSYPHMYDPSSESTTDEFPYTWRFHIKRNSKYDNTVDDSVKFKEALYLPDLINYSHDYVVTYQNINTVSSDPFDIQKYIIQKCDASFKALYIKKDFISKTMTKNQCYYMRVDESLYGKNTGLSICFTEKNSPNTIFKPSNHLLYEDYSKIWYLAEDKWLNDGGVTAANRAIKNFWFIALFDANYKSSGTNVFSTVTGSLSFKSGLKSHLISLQPSFTWDDIYISSFGISPTRNFGDTDYLLDGISEDVTQLGFLDSYINIGGIDYGKSTGKVVVGFKDVFDYKHNDSNHFKYIGGEYRLVKCNEFSSNEYDVVPASDNSYTAYIMNYPNL